MSVWRIEEGGSNLDRVLTALAANRQDVDHVEYVLFDDSIVSDLGIKIVKTEGNTPDTHANRTWHYDLVELSGARLAALANGMFLNSETGLILNKRVLGLLRAAIANAEIDVSKLKSKLSTKVSVGPMPPARRFLRMCQQIGSAIGSAWQEFRRG
jgi:hypothetical protein